MVATVSRLRGQNIIIILCTPPAVVVVVVVDRLGLTRLFIHGIYNNILG